ncbi:hypothetical protein MTR67_046980 [Solanum verrucosum]|uniref:Uncharacterized protein n=1 Tax=Solanum verrucosum TaxID=315347 RepID=A0AAF0UWY7_SOLVR|nr:hypothetical protein MTR67_046980 [Solanum verrucosum]
MREDTMAVCPDSRESESRVSVSAWTEDKWFIWIRHSVAVADAELGRKRTSARRRPPNCSGVRERSGAGGARHNCFAVECEREVTLACGEENEVGEGAVMVVKRFFGQIWWCSGLGCCFCGGWRRKE